MKLDVPFYKQTNLLNCGPVALKMVLDYFGKFEEIKNLEKRTGIKEGKGIFTIQIANAAASLGYRTDFYSKQILFNEENMKHEFYKKYSEMNLELFGKLLKEAKANGVKIQEKMLSLEELLGFVTKKSVPIILLDWNIIKEKKGYQGHFVPIVGFDEQNIYVHNPGLNESQEFMKISRETFDKARKSEGTDEDVVVIYKNQKKE